MIRHDCKLYLKYSKKCDRFPTAFYSLLLFGRSGVSTGIFIFLRLYLFRYDYITHNQNRAAI